MSNIIKEIESKKGNWIYIAPIDNLKLGDAVNGYMTVDRISFVSINILRYNWKKFGLPLPLYKLKKKYHIDNLLSASDTFAIMRQYGVGEKNKAIFLETLRNECLILTASQLSYSRRKQTAVVDITGAYCCPRIEYLSLIDEHHDGVYHRANTGRIMSLSLDGRWKHFHRKSFFIKLLSLFDNRNNKDDYLNCIKRCMVCIGKSWRSSEIESAFLWNMIAIDSLIMKNRDKQKADLPRKINAFIGWGRDYSAEVIAVYKKRCDLVHEGKYADIEIKDILLLDEILNNLLYNIINHYQDFSSKDKISDFVKKVEAEALLEAKPKVRPKTLHYIKIHYNSHDYESL